MFLCQSLVDVSPGLSTGTLAINGDCPKLMEEILEKRQTNLWWGTEASLVCHYCATSRRRLVLSSDLSLERLSFD